jgi:SAM-dependent methyltransferase
MDDVPNTNFFLRRYPYPDQLVAVGLDDQSDLRRRYPSVTFVQADGRSLPFADDQFDVVHSNAVIEHVGGSLEQRQFAAELVRVARSGFVTTPNRSFPIEAHSRLPLLHWLPRPALLRAMRALGHDDWPVWLLSASGFRRLFPVGVQTEFHSTRMAGLPASLVIIFYKHASENSSFKQKRLAQNGVSKLGRPLGK